MKSVLQRMEEYQENKVLDMKAAKEDGRKLVGFYCAYSPRELAVAAGAMSASLCGSVEEPLKAADRDLPRNLCPVVRSIYELAATDTCPFHHFSDFIVAETTCDGRKKAYEIMQQYKPIHVMNLPQQQDNPSSSALWREEIARLRRAMESGLGIEITDEDLLQAIAVVDDERRLMKEVLDLNRRIPAVLSGQDLVTIMAVSGYGDPVGCSRQMLSDLLEAVRQNEEAGTLPQCSGPRILLTGTPIGYDTAKVVDLVEECGGHIVAMENCGSYKLARSLADTSELCDPLDILAAKYLAIPCSVMSPNNGRLQLLDEMIGDFAIDGVIDLVWRACHTYSVESAIVARYIEHGSGKPCMALETDFGSSDLEQLRVRLQAFIEMF